MPTRPAVSRFVPPRYAPAPSELGEWLVSAPETARCAQCALGAVLAGLCDRCGASVGVEVSQ